jgi:predicted DNA-binding transcriptional regulator AlpA
MTLKLSDLVDRTEICERWGISRARWYQLLEEESFPEPVRVFGNGSRVWSWPEVDAWRSERKIGGSGGKPAALSHPCPTCGAAAHLPCIRVSTDPPGGPVGQTTTPHAERA